MTSFNFLMKSQTIYIFFIQLKQKFPYQYHIVFKENLGYKNWKFDDFKKYLGIFFFVIASVFYANVDIS